MFPLTLVMYAIGIRSFRPFLNEIILLEQNPLVSRDAQQITSATQPDVARTGVG
jgi:hypothetical protein